MSNLSGLSIIVETLNSILTSATNMLLYPLRSLSPGWGLVFISILSGILLLLLYGRISNQRGLRQVKDKIYAALLEAVLYRHDIGVSLRAQGAMFAYGFRYFAYAVPPILILAIPCVLILAQLNARYDVEPLRVGERATVRLRLDDQSIARQVNLRTDEGLAVVTPPLHILDEGEILWQVEPQRSGNTALAVEVQGERIFEQRVFAGERAEVIPSRKARSWMTALLYPGERMLDPASPISELVIEYPAARYSFLGIGFHWLVVFLIVSILAGLAASRVFQVEI